ncbi:unnamed protein product [Prunus brigantina]
MAFKIWIIYSCDSLPRNLSALHGIPDWEKEQRHLKRGKWDTWAAKPFREFAMHCILESEAIGALSCYGMSWLALPCHIQGKQGYLRFAM